MSGPEDRRDAPRILTDFSLMLQDDVGVILDDRAFAHDVSGKGFKAETQAELKKDQMLRFSLAIRGEELQGRGRVVWVTKTDMSFWVGVQFSGMSWADQRKIRRVTSPGDVEWGQLADKAIVALLLLLGATVSWVVTTNPIWRQVVPSLLPKAAAAVVMGLALRVMLSPRR
jgi:hypothetical protein